MWSSGEADPKECGQPRTWASAALALSCCCVTGWEYPECDRRSVGPEPSTASRPYSAEGGHWGYHGGGDVAAVRGGEPARQEW